MRAQRSAAEALGTALLLATVIGSGIMGERLAGGNVALALLGNTLATGAMLVVLIGMFGPISGAHFNPAVTAVFALKGRLTPGDAAGYVLAQMRAASSACCVAHAMFDESCCRFPPRCAPGRRNGCPSGWRRSGWCDHPADAARKRRLCRYRSGST